MAPAYDKRQLLKSAYNYTQAGQWDRALDEYRRVNRLFPDDPNIHSMIADLLIKKDELVEAAQQYLLSARLHADQGADDKALGVLRKAARTKAGDAEVLGEIEKVFARALQRAQTLLDEERLEEGEEVCQRLLDADPGHLGVNRLMDQYRAKRAQAEARAALDEEAAIADVLTAKDDDEAEATRMVIERMDAAAEQYLQAEDFDNAIQTFVMMLQIAPSRIETRARLEEAQLKLAQKQQAQQAWMRVQHAQTDELQAAKTREQIVQQAQAWTASDEELREQLDREQLQAEQAAQSELAIVERAMREIQERRQGAPVAVGAASADADDARMRALESEKSQLLERLAQEQARTDEATKALRDELAREAEVLQHAIEMATQEAEAKAKAAALKELQERMDAERREHQASLEAERARALAHEAELKREMQDLMRTEMAKLREEVQQQSAVNEVQRKLDEEQQHLRQLEEQTKAKELELASRVLMESESVEREKREAEDAARKEREAIQQLKLEEEARKKALLERALEKRGLRMAPSETQEKAAVTKASRKISDVLHAAATKHLEQDVGGMLDTARRYLKQDLLLDAMRICQTIIQKDPANARVKEILKEIYVKKGL